MDLHPLTPILLAVVVVWAVFRRIRRTIGRQPLQTRRLRVRIGILAVVGVLMLIATCRHPPLIGALFLGGGAGALLGAFGLRHTKFESTAEGRFYTPHTYIGIGVILLFVGRLVYRFATLHGEGSPVTAVDRGPLAALQGSPVTLGIFGLLIGYYLVFNVGVLSEQRYGSGIEEGVHEA
jgi:cytochrome b561